MNANLNNRKPKDPQEESCLTMINNFRKQVQEYLNQCLHDTVDLEGGNEEKAKKIYLDMLNFLDVSTMLDILTDWEREDSYNKIHNFFSGLEVEIFEFPEIQEHYFQQLGYSVLDLVLVYKVNIQERINENLKIYREFKIIDEKRFEKKDYLDACYGIMKFCKHFNLLTEKEIVRAREILDEHKKNKFKNTEIIFIPKNMYSKI